MAVSEYHDFFVATSSVLGALIGLLFVALSVTQDRLSARHGGQLHRIRASAALTAFTNALVVSLFGLVPDFGLGSTAVTVGSVGVAFLLGAALSLRHAPRSWSLLRDAGFLVGLAVVFSWQIVTGLDMGARPYSAGDLQRLATLVVVCALLGVARSWELIGAPSVSLPGQVVELGREAARHVPGRDTSRSGHDRSEEPS